MASAKKGVSVRTRPKEVDEETCPIGIDLGTTYTCAGAFINDWVEIITNEEGNRKTPSYVAFRETERYIGDAAKEQAPMNPTNTMYDVKRILGRKFSDPSVQNDMELWPFRVTPGPREQPMICVKYHGEETYFTAEEVCAMMLSKIKENTEAFLKSPVTECVIAVPANFSIAQRLATANAGVMAGLSVLKIVTEPTAAALAYALHKESVMEEGEERYVLIFDLGGGTVSVSVIHIQEGILEVKAMAGDSHLGGGDFDRRLVRHFVKEFKNKHFKDISGNPRALRKLESACEKVKRSLSMIAKTTIDIDALYEGIDFYCSITRGEFEEMNLDLFYRCLLPVQSCLRDANISKEAIQDIVLVGGSTRIPKVQQLLQEFFDGKELCKNVNPDEAVAFGAAMYAAILGGKQSRQLQAIRPLEVTPMSIGLEVAGGTMAAMIARNTSIPTTKSMEFCIHPNYHTCVVLQVYEGEEDRAANNELVGVYELVDLPPAPADGLTINVIFEIDSLGNFIVKAEDSDGERIKCLMRMPTTPLYPVEIRSRVDS